MIEFLPRTMKLIHRVRNVPRTAFLLSSFLGLTLLLACSFGCAPPVSESDGLPELTEEIIRERINDTGVWKVPEENAAGEPINWNFDEDEPKELVIVEKKIEGTRATVLLDIKTRSSARSRSPRVLAGQLRTDWELRTGLALRRWEIVWTENISMKYKNLPAPPAQNFNR